MRKVIATACVALAAFGLPTSSSALEKLTATFETVAGNGPTGPVPGGTVTIELQPDGTIAATASTFGPLNLWGIGLDSSLLHDNYGFAFPYADSTAWQTSFGGFWTGWITQYDHLSEATTQSWLIGTPGTFTSLSQLLNGNHSSFDVFMFAVHSQTLLASEYAANFSTLAPIPEPETYALLAAGLVALAISRRRIKATSRGIAVLARAR